MEESNKWIVAVSGGPDSMALLHLMIEKGLECIVGHVNYHMRPESGSEEAMVREYCKNKGIDLYVKDYENSAGGNFQAKARAFRYDFFKELSIKYNAQGIVVGHHLDDDIETYVFQRDRKMKSDYVGLKEFGEYQGITVWRPLLDKTKDELIELCEQAGIPFMHDASNFELNYTRNKIRHFLGNREEIYKEMIGARRDHQMRIETIEELLGHTEDTLNLDVYKDIDKEYRIDFLRSWFVTNSVHVYDYTESFFKEVDRQIIKGASYHDFGDIKLYCDHDLIVLTRNKEFSYIFDEVPDIIPGICEFKKEGRLDQAIDFKEQDFPITIRSWKEGDKIQKEYGTKSVSRYFIDRKIHRSLRNSWLVIENASHEIIYVMGMGCDVAHLSNNPSHFVIELYLS